MRALRVLMTQCHGDAVPVNGTLNRSTREISRAESGTIVVVLFKARILMT